MKGRILPFLLIGIVGCTSEHPAQLPPQGQAPHTSAIQLQHDLSASDFKAALIGKWESAFTYKSKPNVQDVEFKPDGTATLVLQHNGETKHCSGHYAVSFEKEPEPRSTTFATITVKQPDSDSIILSRVNFDLHSGVYIKHGLLLRIDREPYGALRRIN